jgi:hypothetical protein
MALSLVNMATPSSTPESKASAGLFLLTASIRTSSAERQNASSTVSMLNVRSMLPKRVRSAAAIRPARRPDIRLASR